MAGSLVAVGAVYYVVQATASDGDLLDLDNIELSQSSLVVATDPDTGAQVEYATLRSSNSHRVWADLEQIPTQPTVCIHLHRGQRLLQRAGRQLQAHHRRDDQ